MESLADLVMEMTRNAIPNLTAISSNAPVNHAPKTVGDSE